MKRFFKSLQTMARVIYALMMREIITRYGRKGLGFLWLFIEPVLFIGAFTLIRAAFREVKTEKDFVLVVTLLITGLSSQSLWRHSVSRVMNAIQANLGLFYHRNITVMDVFLARILLEITAITGVFMVLSFILVFSGFMYPPSDLFYTVIGWLLQIWFAVGLALFVGSLANKWETVQKFWGPIGLILFITGGTFYFVEWLPPELRQYAMLIPTVNNIELIRYGFLGDLMTPYYDIEYSATFNLFLLLLGLITLKYVEETFEPE